MAASTLKRLDPTQVELEFGVDSADLERARERAFRELSRNARLPGFRPGKAPRKIFEAHYGSEGIEQRAREEVLNAAYGRALEENSLDPLANADVEELPAEDDSSDLRFRARVSVRPEIALGTYKGIRVNSPPVVPSDDDVAVALEELRQGESVLIPADRPVQIGDIATLDYTGTIDGVAFEGGTATNSPTQIVEGRFIPGFVDGIVGMRAGESKDVGATFPSDYASAELAGKAAVFAVTVHDVKEAELPALDDEFAARFHQGEGGTLEALRADVRARIERANSRRARQSMVSELLERLRGEHEVPLPEILVDREAETMLDDMQRQTRRGGLDWSTFLERSGRSEEDLRAQLRSEAEQRVKTGLLLEAIARKENIGATDADVDSELANLSSQYGRPKAEILETVRPNIRGLIDGITRSKTLDFLIDNAEKVEASRAPAS